MQKCQGGKQRIRQGVIGERMGAGLFTQFLAGAVQDDRQVHIGRSGVAQNRLQISLEAGIVQQVRATDHMGYGIGFPDIGEKFVTQALALGGTGDQSRDVGEFDRGCNNLLRLDDRGQPVQALIGDGDDSGIWLDGAEGKILGGDAGLGEGIE